MDDHIAAVWQLDTAIPMKPEEDQDWSDSSSEDSNGEPVMNWATELSCSNVEANLIECNLALKDLKRHSNCQKCQELVGDLKAVACGLCRQVLHEQCVGSRKPTSYWYCQDCSLQLDSRDPAQNLALHRVLTTG